MLTPKKAIKTISLVATLSAALLILGCNSGNNSWTPPSLGVLSTTITTNNLSLSGVDTATITASLTGAKGGTDGMPGAANINFYVIQDSSFESSNIASANPTSCIISNPAESNITSCSVQLQGLAIGAARVAVTPNALGSINQGTVFESLVVTP